MPTRRSLLIASAAVAGGAVFGAAWLRSGDRIGPAAVFASADAVALNGWLRIDASGRVTVAVPRTDMGQGVHNALAMIAADELDADWSRVRTTQAPLHRVYANLTVLEANVPFEASDETIAAALARRAFRATARSIGLDITGNSTSVRDAWDSTRLAAASAREQLRAAAARRWRVLPEQCTCAAGTVSGPAGQRLDYGDLAVEAAGQPVQRQPPLKRAGQRTLLGQALPRAEVPPRVDGSLRFGADIREPDMRFASIRHGRPLDAAAHARARETILARRGVMAVVDLHDATAVIADNWWRADQAAGLLELAPAPARVAAVEPLAALDTGEPVVHQRRGDPRAALARGAQRINATYTVPMLAHAPMEPMSATARYADGRLRLWAGTQSPMLARVAAAAAAGLDPDQVAVEPLAMGGSFGRRTETDFIRQVTGCAMALPGTCVQLQWNRAEDMRHDCYRPAAAARFEAALDAAGAPIAWFNRIASASVYESVMRRMAPLLATDMRAVINTEGAVHLPYDLGALQVEHVICEPGHDVGYWRSVGHSFNAFFKESFIDELAVAAGADPLAWRLARLAGSPRHARALQVAAREAGWNRQPGPGRGMGCALHACFGSIVAVVASVQVDAAALQVERIVCVLDCGTVVNPDTVLAQIEGGVTFGLSAALWGRIDRTGGQVLQGNFDDYRIARRADLPAISGYIIANGEAPGGVGETAVPPVAPAIANAVFAASGRRLRDLPLAAALERG